MNDQIEIKDLDQGVPVQADWLVFQKVSDGVVYKAPKSDIEGEDAFVYIGYADDDIGTGFTLTFDANKDYIAIKSTNTEIANPVVGDFAGLWKNYKGQKGDTGDTGAKPISVAFSGNNMVFVLEDSSTITLTNAKIDLKGDKGDTGVGITSIVKTSTLGLVDTYTITYSNSTTSTFDVTNGAKGDKGDKGDIGPQGIQGIQGIQGNPGINGIDGTDGISFTPKGAYNALTEYVANDVVSYLGSSWIALQTTTGNTPEESAYWTLNASKGTDGEGSGDMLASVYDPTNVAGDAFDMDNMAQGTTNKFLSSAELTVVQNTSGTNTGDQEATDFDIKDLTDSTNLRTTWNGKVDKSLFDANTILYATTDDTPVALTIPEQTIVGRKTGGNIEALAIDSDLSSVSANDDTVPSAKATKDYADSKVEDSIVDGHTTIAPSGNAVFDALALKDTKTDLTKYSNLNAPEGFLINGKIVPSVASNNLTVAIKGLDGNDPSASNPVYIRIGDTIRSITSALSVTKNAGTNWFNAGSSELATKEIDYFVYLGYNSTDGVTIGFSRIPYATLYSDFSATSTNERYAGISTITNAIAGDNYRNIGRFSATLSAGAGYTWTVPTFTSANLIQTPIFETRILDYAPSVTTQTGSITSFTSANKYRVKNKDVLIYVYITITNNGTGSGGTIFSLPFTISPSELGQITGRTAGTTGKLFGGQLHDTYITIWNYDNTYASATNAIHVGTANYPIN